MTTQIGYYVDENSVKVCSTEFAPSGCHFEFQDGGEYKQVMIISNGDGEVLQELVFWPSLESLRAVGVDIGIR